MYSTNQVFAVSGEYRTLPDAIKMAFRLDGRQTEQDFPTGYQIIGDNYILGVVPNRSMYPDCPWQAYPFDTDVDIISSIVVQFLKKQHCPPGPDGDGTTHDGFLLMAPQTMPDAMRLDIPEDFRAVAVIKPWPMFYHK